jgi:hypothetical protein
LNEFLRKSGQLRIEQLPDGILAKPYKHSYIPSITIRETRNGILGDRRDFLLYHSLQEKGIDTAFTFHDDYKIYTYRQGNRKMGFWKLPEMLDSYMAAYNTFQ